MIEHPPIPFRWQGDAFVPLPRYKDECDRTFIVGEVYRLCEEKGRSRKSHDHYFAELANAFDNLPEHMAGQFPTVEHLRKWALIKAGFTNSRQFVASSRAEALRLAAFIRPLDEYSVVTVSGAIVTQWTAQSQSKRAMGGADFQASKQAVLDVVAQLCGTTSQTLATASGWPG